MAASKPITRSFPVQLLAVILVATINAAAIDTTNLKTLQPTPSSRVASTILHVNRDYDNRDLPSTEIRGIRDLLKAERDRIHNFKDSHGVTGDKMIENFVRANESLIVAGLTASQKHSVFVQFRDKWNYHGDESNFDA
jgi:hypothetical protein